MFPEFEYAARVRHLGYRFEPQTEWFSQVHILLDAALAEHEGKKMVMQMATFFKAIAAIEGKQDLEAGLKLIDAAQAADPDSEFGSKKLPEIRKQVEGMRGRKKEAGGGDKGGNGGEQGGK